MTLFEALMYNGTARSGDGKVVVQRKGWMNQVASGDYFWKSKNKPFLCEHDGELYPCALVERADVNGMTDDGKEYWGTVWVTIVDEATVSDL